MLALETDCLHLFVVSLKQRLGHSSSGPGKVSWKLLMAKPSHLIAMKKGYFFLLDITGLIVTFTVNQVVLGSPYLYALENSGSLLV